MKELFSLAVPMLIAGCAIGVMVMTWANRRGLREAENRGYKAGLQSAFDIDTEADQSYLLYLENKIRSQRGR